MRVWTKWKLAALAAMIGISGPAHAAWHEAKSRHFIIYADAPAEELRKYAIKLERFDRAVRVGRQMADPALTDANRLTIYMLRDNEEVGRMSGGGGSVYGFYIPRASGSYAFVPRKSDKSDWDLTADTIFFHEYAHHLMLQNSAAAYPEWLVEGFAEFLSTAKVNEDGSVTLGAPATHRAIGVLAINHELSLKEMLGGNTRQLTRWQQELVYARGWLLTHYQTFNQQRQGQLERYVRAISGGQNAADAAVASFGDLKALRQELDAYAKQRKFTGLTINPAAGATGAVAIRALRPAESAIMPMRIRSDAGVNVRTAKQVASDARKVAVRFPNDPFVQATLAEAEFDAKNFPAALAAADQALAARPDDQRALIYKGRVLMAMGKKDPARADWKTIRSYFTRANRADPDDAEPLMLFYESQRLSGMPVTANATKGLLYALTLAPQDDGLRMMAVRQLLAEGRVADARREFAPLAFDPHAGTSKDTVNKIMAAMVGNDVKTARALVEQWYAEKEKD